MIEHDRVHDEALEIARSSVHIKTAKEEEKGNGKRNRKKNQREMKFWEVRLHRIGKQ